MMPAETFSGEPTPRLRLIQQSSSHAPRYQKHPLSCPCERQTFLCAKRERSPRRIMAAAIVPLHPILGRTPKLVSYSSVDGKDNKRTAGTNEKRSATCLRRNSCAHDHLFRHQSKERRKLEKLALAFPSFSAQFRHS